MERSSPGSPIALLALLLLAAVFYCTGLDNLHIPSIGDEPVYEHITRKTAESGQWLPLRADPDFNAVTKPPLLFWQGMVVTGFGEHWVLWRLRLSTVLFTCAVAALAFVLGRRAGGDWRYGALAALTFLGFGSTVQHGRPFLTNMPETLFLFAPLFLLLMGGRAAMMRWWPWLAGGLLLGIGTLYKSPLLVAPVALAAALVVWQWRDAGQPAERWLQRGLTRVTVMALVAAAAFLLWPLADPDPGAIVDHYLLEENIAKFSSGDGYLAGLFGGRYPVWRVWFGHLANAALFMGPLIWVAVHDWRHWRELGPLRRALWLVVLAFVVAYTLPSQRQENYLLPTVPALAVLIALRWGDIPAGWFRAFVLVPAGVFGLLVWMMRSLSPALPEPYAPWQLALPLAGLALSAAVLLRPVWGRGLFHLTVFVAWFALSALIAPFGGEHGRYPAAVAAELAGERVYVPSSFNGHRERHSFLLPGTELGDYWHTDTARRDRLLASGFPTAVLVPWRQRGWPGCEVLASRIEPRTRIPNAEARAVLTGGAFDRLLMRELLVRCPPAQMAADAAQ